MAKRSMCLSIVCAALVLGVTGSTTGQTVATRQLMREKLELSHHILDAVMTSNYDALEHDSVALSRLPERAGWMVFQTPEYVRYSGAFVNAAQDLAAAAKDRDLDAAAVRYASMTMACYQCHRYVARARQTEK